MKTAGRKFLLFYLVIKEIVKMKPLFFIILVCFLFTGCSGKAKVHHIDAKQAYEMMNENVVVLDVRSVSEYEEEHIVGAKNIPLNFITEDNEALPLKDVTILVYCKSGGRSEKASQKLIQLGYKNVYNFGGIDDWPYQTESGAIIESKPSIEANQTQKRIFETEVNQIMKAVQLEYMEMMLDFDSNVVQYEYPFSELGITMSSVEHGIININKDGKFDFVLYNDIWCAKKIASEENPKIEFYQEGQCQLN